MWFLSSQLRRTLLRESIVVLCFLVLTAIMTWPWLMELRDGIPDQGDPYAHSYFLWWAYHQTLHDPLNLFNATVFFPYQNSLAFGEFDYGISLVFFPLFALGFRPLTIYSLAAFLSFPFTGYGMFRLARTLSGSTAIAWVAATILMFLPFRFHHLSHLPLIFAGWIPLLFEALVIFVRRRTWSSATYLGISFVMNGLTCTSWLILTLVPLTFSLAFLLIRTEAWRDRKFWLRGASVIILGSVVLLPFLLPLERVARTHGFVRSMNDVKRYSARPINWLAADERNKVWRGLGRAGVDTEMVLFPGLMAPLLSLAAFFLPQTGFRNGEKKSSLNSADKSRMRWPRVLVVVLDLTALFAGSVCILTLGYDVFRLRFFSHVVFTLTEAYPTVAIFVLVVVIRCCIAYPAVIRTAMRGDKNLVASIRSPQRSELFSHGLIWAIIGFMGSFGVNFFFHRLLYDLIPVFRGMRVATRWAMICYVGLSLLAGLGASRLARSWGGLLPRYGQTFIYAALLLLVLVELHAAPLRLVHGEPDPDQLTLFLKAQKIAGGIVELPFGEADHFYMLRAADHGQHLVNGISSFVPPLQQEIGRLTRSDPIPDQLLDIFENIPVSYVTVRYSRLLPDARSRIESFLSRGLNLGRLRFIKSFGDVREGITVRDDLYAVVKTEPLARGETTPPGYLFDGRVFSLFSGRATNLPISPDVMIRYYQASYGRLPTFAEFVEETETRITRSDNDETRQQDFARAWVARPEFVRTFDGMSDEQYLATVLGHTGMDHLKSAQNRMLAELQSKRRSRADVLREIVEDPIFAKSRAVPSFILMSYFEYLERDPDKEGFNFWLDSLNRSADFEGVVRTFANSPERHARNK